MIQKILIFLSVFTTKTTGNEVFNVYIKTNESKMINCGIIFQTIEFKCQKIYNKESFFLKVDCPKERFNGKIDINKLYKIKCQFIGFKKDSSRIYKLTEIMN